jgi:hypothetical protein
MVDVPGRNDRPEARKSLNPAYLHSVGIIMSQRPSLRSIGSAVWVLVVLPASALATSGDPTCITTASKTSLAKRASPLDSTTFRVGAATVKICYGRPSARGRTMIGGYNVPFGKLWRTGANEPTMIHVTGGSIVVAGVRLEPGTYSLYTIPGESEWVIIANRSIEQWGDEGSYEPVKGMELGRARVKSQILAEPIEQLTIRVEPAKGYGASLILEWEKIRVAIPVEPAK